MKITRFIAILLIVIPLILSACSTTSSTPENQTSNQQEQESGTPQEANLPYSWTDNGIRITINGIFKADRNTEEGFIGDNEEQYKVLISYENTSQQMHRVDATVGHLKLMTSDGNLYDPEYIGGESCYFLLSPQGSYQTHNYAFNIQETEEPLELWKYESEDKENPSIIFDISALITPPTMRILELGQALQIDEFEFLPLSAGSTELIITGAYAGGVYYLAEAKTGYRFVYLEIEVINNDNERKQPPISGRDGEFTVQTDKGNIYQDIYSIASLGFGSERWAGEASAEDMKKYPILVSYAFELQPSERVKLVKAFEIPEDSYPVCFTFQLLDDIRTVQINIITAPVNLE